MLIQKAAFLLKDYASLCSILLRLCQLGQIASDGALGSVWGADVWAVYEMGPNRV